VLNLAFYHRQGDGSDNLFRPVILRQSGLRSIMVTDVDVDRISGGEALELEQQGLPIDSLPLAVLRYEGKPILLIGPVDAQSSNYVGELIDHAIALFAPTEKRTHP